jgi:hypothetical protein
VSEYLVKKGWYAKATFTGGLNLNMQKEFEAWPKERGWYYQIVE